MFSDGGDKGTDGIGDMSFIDSWLGKVANMDCLDFMAQAPDACVDLVVTSPPYPGVDAMWGELFAPENFEQAHEWLGKVWAECVRILRPGCKLAINIANTERRPYLPNAAKLYQTVPAEPLGEIIWHKGLCNHGTAWGSYRNPSDPSLTDHHEYIVIFRKDGERAKQPGYFIDKADFLEWRNTLWKFETAKAGKVGHCAPFPEILPYRLIQLYSYPGEVVFDPFMGAGTTAIAAERLGRKWCGTEINAEYADLANKRIERAREQGKLEFEG